ncbi:hypothetical protein [Bacillus gobiensis]|uniref:Uncharacterized protein n=1 Tax=Bacillus gobiensis TaxID=1441095 RepID=A0A0M4FE79_9BACI|nr:hypothetical protein [Bacillus gobiensis]ALC80424.1 hypothetical protein AM592_01615 [Bacillus gobiensis]
MAAIEALDRLEIALEDTNFEWSLVQMRKTLTYWYEGRSIREMSELLIRPLEELLLLIVDFAKQRILPHRSNGLGPCEAIWISKNDFELKNKRIRELLKDGPVYIVFLESNFLWYEYEIKQFQCMWDKGESIVDISESFMREIEEVLFLTIHSAKQGLIDPRESGLLGKEASDRERKCQGIYF